jgi:hypothetical protein
VFVVVLLDLLAVKKSRTKDDDEDEQDWNTMTRTRTGGSDANAKVGNKPHRTPVSFIVG